MRFILILTSVLLGVTACGSSTDGQRSRPGGEDLQVVAAFYPLEFAARDIGGSSVTVENVTPPGAEPHDVELSPRTVERVRDADVVLYLGSNFQPAMEEAVRGASGETVDLLQGLPLLPTSGERDWGDLRADPHVWLDPLLYARIARRIAVGLHRGSASPFVARLRRLDATYRRGLAHCERRDIVTSHEAFGYLAKRYGLRQIAITGLSPEAEPTPRELERVAERVRATHATAVFFETLVSPDLARTVARETGAQALALDPIEGLTKDELARGTDYFSVMRANLRTLRQALSCR